MNASPLVTFVVDQLHAASVLQVMRKFIDEPQALLRSHAVAGQQIDIAIKVFWRTVRVCERRFSRREGCDLGGDTVGYVGPHTGHVSRRASCEPKAWSGRMTTRFVLSRDSPGVREQKERPQLDRE